MSLVTRFEQNSLRKSYRTTIPLQVAIEGTIYHAIDWSLTGLALTSSELKTVPGNEIEAQLILPIHDARLSLPVTLYHEYTQEDRHGFSFSGLSEKHKNVLRRFIEMAIEGKIDRVDDIVAIYEEPEIATPIQTPVTLHEEEVHALKRSFFRTSARYLLFMVAVLALLGLLLFYNLRYLYEGSGVVSGNDLMVYPPVSAIVEKLYVHEGEKVMPGVPLVQLDSSDVSYKLALQEVERKRKVELFRQREALLKEKRQMRERMIRLAKQRVSVTSASYRNAKAQYDRQLITKSTLQKAKSVWLDARQNLEKVKLLSSGSDESNDTALQNALELEKAGVKLEYLKKQLPLYHIVAPAKGTVYEIYVQEGQEATKSNPLLLLWTEQAPYITASVPVKYLSDIVMGTEVEIIDKNENVTLHGKVYKTGSLGDTAAQSDTFTVYIRPQQPALYLKPHQRVQLLFKRDF
ncbi:MAG: hypothetical protein DSZ05_00440 [Sulfurospirillum sp.]|nr:MAG: hypothetical protein DSZ05_00440 [Sulfurospirillum sp.]